MGWITQDGGRSVWELVGRRDADAANIKGGNFDISVGVGSNILLNYRTGKGGKLEASASVRAKHSLEDIVPLPKDR